jgi:phosphomethylpyrimidine synthase
MTRIDEKVLKKAVKSEDTSLADVKKGVRSGYIVVPNNKKRRISKPCAIGKGMTTKVNANIGLSPGKSSLSAELKKMEVAIKAGADTVMDLSTGPLLKKVRKEIISNCDVPLGTVPVYEIACFPGRKFDTIKESAFLDVLEKQAEEGVDFFTVHAGITLDAVRLASKNPRIINIVSRGGSLLASWMARNKRENPFLSQYDKVLDICKKYNVTISLGDSLRPGAIGDATDQLQIQELIVLGSLQQRALVKGVQVMIEGPGHVPLDQIEVNVKLEKRICHGAPFYVLGPLVTDAAAGYDHITSAIGGAIAAWHGADFLCYVTPAEHLSLPDLEDVKRGVMASRIAAHAADIVKGLPSAIKRDTEISKARARRDWKKQFYLSLDPEFPEKIRERSKPKAEDICTMCGEYCSIKIAEECLKTGKRKK